MSLSKTLCRVHLIQHVYVCSVCVYVCDIIILYITVLYAYNQCLLCFGFCPDIWYEAALYLQKACETCVRICIYIYNFMYIFFTSVLTNVANEEAGITRVANISQLAGSDCFTSPPKDVVTNTSSF